MEYKSFIFEVRSRYKEFRPSEQKAADIILNEDKRILDWTIEEFAQAAGVSQPTVIRFARALGLKGYRELKNKVLEEYARKKEEPDPAEILNYPVQKEDRIVDIPAKVIMTNIRHLEEVLKALSSYEFVRAVNALEKAENISVYAVENSSCTAEDFATKMTYIGKQVYFNKDGYMQKVNAKNLTERDVAMGISHTGQSRHTVDALRCAKESGAMTIAITNYQQALINKYADIILCTENTQYMYGNAIFSRSAQISLVDMLYLGVFLKNYDYYAEKLNNSWKNIQDLVYERDSRF
ncbi:MAG TPA: MurR/RpiR family transcriptional regulator [Candidatus Blautia merdigallinarum]|uniref:MurR/RpiR family transcriptional regulator n=1 Tax=Candidatus Blautia merdigallinarum TaxID=2838495 RepID=A0A9D2SLV9_9FIRM|nr:MurR/RpiR family transcriptional regulator [Candidatus Blautia merdigallinarum]